MEQEGSLAVRLFTSSAMIPLQGASVSITQTQPSGARVLLGARRTNFDGLTEPLPIAAPPAENSRNFSPGRESYASVEVLAACNGFRRAQAQGVQIFPGVQTILPLELVPLPALPERFTQPAPIRIPAQSLSEV